jgi:ArsR family transcriptional regulator, lead/cadmium/zinc/bismuth-responsive transcriptional repressor
MILRFAARYHYDRARVGLDVAQYMSYCSYMQTSAPSLLSDAALVQALADTFRILGDPTRVRIVDALAQGQLCVHEISERIGISESAISHQLRLMRSMRIVRGRREGRCVYYTLDDQHVLDLFQQGLRHVSEERA